MKSFVKVEKSGKKNALAICVGSKNKVNDMMLQLMEAGFTVAYEPRFVSEYYEGCFICEDNLLIKIRSVQNKEKILLNTP